MLLTKICFIVDGVDYTFANTDIFLQQNSSFQCFTVPIISDNRLEISETFHLILSTNDVDIILEESLTTTMITILNDDGEKLHTMISSS